MHWLRCRCPHGEMQWSGGVRQIGEAAGFSGSPPPSRIKRS
jgi:hypothetical protein